MGLTLAMTLIIEFSSSYVILTIWWPRSGVMIYQIVTGVTSDVGVPSTHLVVIEEKECLMVLYKFLETIICWFCVSPRKNYCQFVDNISKFILRDRNYCTVRCRYNAVNFLQNSHNRHPIPRPWGRGMGCLLWVWSLIYILLLDCILIKIFWTWLMISHHWFRQWLGAIRQQAITWTNVYQDQWCHMMLLGPN